MGETPPLVDLESLDYDFNLRQRVIINIFLDI